MKCYIHNAVRKLFLKLLIISSLFFVIACNQYYTNQSVEIKEDGLIYKVGQDNPYTGRIIDTLQNTVSSVCHLRRGLFQFMVLLKIIET